MTKTLLLRLLIESPVFNRYNVHIGSYNLDKAWNCLDTMCLSQRPRVLYSVLSKVSQETYQTRRIGMTCDASVERRNKFIVTESLLETRDKDE